MRHTHTRAGLAGLLLLSTTLMLGGCGTPDWSCKGWMNDHECSASWERVKGQRWEQLSGSHSDTAMDLSGTFAITSGSGILIIKSFGENLEYDLAPGEPVVIDDLTLQMAAPEERNQSKHDPAVVIRVETDTVLEGFTAEIEYSTYKA